MGEFIENPRSTPRVPVRCRAQLITGAGAYEVETEDVSPSGCQVISPRVVHKGEPVKAVIVHPRVRETLEVAGRIAWASVQQPWRLGIAFDERTQRAARRFYERLLDDDPTLSGLDRIPRKIALESSLFLGTPPRFVLDFSFEETEVLRAIGGGCKGSELKASLGHRWLPCQRALFSLMAHNHVTLNRGQSVHPEAWKAILAKLETLFAGHTPKTTERTVALNISRDRQTETFSLPPGSLQKAPPANPVAAPPQSTRHRSSEAQACFERGLKEQAAGQLNTAMALLRRASQLAPGDQEIRKALSQLTTGRHL